MLSRMCWKNQGSIFHILKVNRGMEFVKYKLELSHNDKGKKKERSDVPLKWIGGKT